MHEAVTNSSTSTKILPSSNSDDLQTPISRKPRLHSTDNFGWSQVNDNNPDYNVENWSTTNDSFPIHLTTGRRNSAGFQKIPYTSNMPARTDNNTSERIQNQSQRWRFNTNGQLVDSEAASWELADEIVRLKIGEVTGDADPVHGSLRTPAKSKLVGPAVTQMTETSPLETSSSTSIGSSPHVSENEISISHSRGSSTDTTMSSSRGSVASISNKVSLTKPPLKVNTGNDIKERPHSFSGGLSTADLRRLQQVGDAPDAQHHRTQGHYRDNMVANAEQLSYPSIVNHIHRPQPQPHPQLYDYRSGTSQLNQAADQDEIQMNYAHQRNFNHVPQAHSLVGQSAGSAFVQSRPAENAPPSGYRQPARGYPQQGVVATPSMGYTAHHTPHLSLGNTQQLYDMMLPGLHHEHPAVARVQQQHNVYRPSHHHSASDPSASIRDAAALALMGNGSIQPFAAGMFQPGMPPMPLYANQFYGTQEQYPLADPAAIASRLPAQYPNQYAVLPPPAMVSPEPMSSPTSNGGPGPSANNRKLGLYKTELCRSWEEKGSCRYGSKCQFAHGEEELRKVARHPKYKTEICRTFWVSGTCPYGKRCCFIHTELPAAGGPAPGGATPSGTDNTTPQVTDGRARSMSTNSDPNETSVSLLARINGKRNPEPTSSATPVDGTPFQFTRPPTGSLRVDTSALDTSLSKQNKSAYPSFASNGILMPAPEPVSHKDPGPVTAGPDLGRHNNARREIVGYNTQRTHKHNTSSTSSIRDLDAHLSSSPPGPSYTLSSGDGNMRPGGHVRAGSAGNWGNFSSRGSHLSQPSYAGTNSAGEIIANSPWPSTELAVGSSRMHEKVWA